MASEAVEADHLIVGAGAVGMAFADPVVAESDATVVIVGRVGEPAIGAALSRFVAEVGSATANLRAWSLSFLR